jgi:thioredoxin-dependent peroxiredoxin
MRQIESLQLTGEYKVATPANWQPGCDVIVLSATSDAAADRLFPKGYRKLKRYQRVTPQPNL